MPSAFLTSLCFDAWYAVLGGCFGAVMFSGNVRKVICLGGVYKYRGAMCFIGMVLLGFLWYPLFFVTAHYLLAALLCLSVIALCIMSGLCFFRVSRFFGGVLLLYATYLFFLFLRMTEVLVA